MRRLLLGVMALWVLGGCAVNPATGKKELALFQISTEQEVAIARKTYPRVLQQMGGEYPDVALNTYVQRVGEAVAKVGHRPDLPYQFKVVNDSAPNAFALPGGAIAISRGLLVNLQNEAQLAAVLGHEVGHVTARHAVQGMQRGALLDVAMAVVGVASGESAYGPLAQQTAQLTSTLVDRSYSREQERESDQLGIDYMVRARYNPQGAVQLQEYFFQKVEGGAEPQWLSGIFRTHPFSKDRLKANRSYVQRTYAAEAKNPQFIYGQEAFSKAVKGLRQSQRGYELYDEARAVESKDLNRAIELYHEALNAAPDEALIYTELGMAYLRAGDLIPARRYLIKAVRLNGAYFKPHLGLGYIHLNKERPLDAIASLERSMDLLPTLEGGFLLAEGYEKSGQRQKALALYRDVAQADPDGKLGQAARGRIRDLERY